MRNPARWVATLGLTATAVCGPLTGASQATEATPSALYAPSALVLTVGHGETAALAAPERAVTLDCATRPVGTHPAPLAACAELLGAGGDPDALQAVGDVLCTREYRPVVVTVDGVWQGRRVSYERAFGNECVRNSHGAFFAF
ncbi:subtilase-type protease inhibitor [Streptomyces sp. NPDC006997]|uniref:subtilase-type protease inhibitor n=1 Tax=Streptomyces sp. NPDC006997 TaxID=3155356 RepID=UPI0033D9C2EA